MPPGARLNGTVNLPPRLKALTPTLRRAFTGRRLLRRGFFALLLAATLATGAGYAWFLDAASVPSPSRLPEGTGIAVLTGGPDRVETGLRLAAADPGAPLIISGVGQNTDIAALAHEVSVEPWPYLDRITLGHAARSTRGNAREIAAWARQNGIGTLAVVTAGFHMPRALLEMRRELPEARLIPYPVAPARARPPAMLREYLKFAGALAGLSAYGRSEPDP